MTTIKATRTVKNPDGLATVFFKRPKCDGYKCPNKPAFSIQQKQLGRKGTMRVLNYCKECAPLWAPNGSTKFYDVKKLDQPPEAETECPNCHNGTLGLENGRIVCRGECGNDFGKEA